MHLGGVGICWFSPVFNHKQVLTILLSEAYGGGRLLHNVLAFVSRNQISPDTERQKKLAFEQKVVRWHLYISSWSLLTFNKCEVYAPPPPQATEQLQS